MICNSNSPPRAGTPGAQSVSRSRLRRDHAATRPTPRDQLKPALKPVAERSPRPVAPGSRQNEGHGRRLTAAFEALELFPALAESRNRVLRLVREEHTSAGDVVAAIESDVSLVIAALRIANRAPAPKRAPGQSRTASEAAGDFRW